MSIDKGNTNASVIYYDSVFGMHLPSFSGQEGGGNLVHFQYNVEATPTTIIINPDRSIVVKQIYPPSQINLTDSITEQGGVFQECMTNIDEETFADILLIRPNPVHDNVNIHLNLKSTSDIELLVYDLSGRIVWQSTPERFNPGQFSLPFNLSDVEKGFYLVLLKLDGEDVAIRKLIKQ